MTVLERQLRDLVGNAAPEPDWVDALAREALGEVPVVPGRRWRLLGTAALAAALAGGVLAVALRRPETAPRPAATTAPAPPTTTAEPQSASPLGAALRTVGVPAGLPAHRAALTDEVVPDTVREIRAQPPVFAFELRNGAACLDVAGYLDCALPATHRVLLEGQLEPPEGKEAETVVVVAPDVASVTIERGDRTIPVELDGRLGRAVAPHAQLDYVVTLRDGSTVRIGRPWPTVPRRPEAPPPTGTGLVNGREILAQAGAPIAVADALRSEPRFVDFVPIEGSLRLLAPNFGAAGSDVYGWMMETKRDETWLCLGDAQFTLCGVPLDVHVLWTAQDNGSPYADAVVGIAAPNVTAAWLEFPDGARVDATLDRRVLTVTIPPELASEDVHLFAQLADGTVVDERPRLLR